MFFRKGLDSLKQAFAVDLPGEAGQELGFFES